MATVMRPIKKRAVNGSLLTSVSSQFLIFDIVDKKYKGKFSPKFVAGSHDPQGQIQGQSRGQKVIIPKHVPTKEIKTYLESLHNFLSKDTNFNQFYPKVTDLGAF